MDYISPNINIMEVNGDFNLLRNSPENETPFVPAF